MNSRDAASLRRSGALMGLSLATLGVAWAIFVVVAGLAHEFRRPPALPIPQWPTWLWVWSSSLSLWPRLLVEFVLMGALAALTRGIVRVGALMSDHPAEGKARRP